jgi:DHA1 family multidrug resistance protein-like MFS transporter/DHA1 family quinolone resistance protein-like MFS transporter
MENTSRGLTHFIYYSIFTASLSLGAYNPLIPLYAEKLGASYFDLGIIGAARFAPYLALPVLVGALSDRFGRRHFYIAGVAGCAIGVAIFPFARNIQHLVMIGLFIGIAYSLMWPTAEALISDFTSASERAGAMGRFSFYWALGFLVGPVVGGYVLENSNFQTLFFTSFIIGTLATFIAFYGLLACRPFEIPSIAVNETRSGSAQAFLSIYLIVITYSIALSLIFCIFPAYASMFGVSAFQIGILFATFGAARAVAFWQSGGIAKIGEERAIVLGLLAQALSLFCLAFLKGFTYFLASAALLGLGTGILTPLSLSMISRITPKGKAGLTIGALEAFFGVGWVIGPSMGGFIAESFSAELPYLIFALTSGLCVVLVALCSRVEFR